MTNDEIVDEFITTHYGALIPEEEGPPESEPWTVTGCQATPGASVTLFDVEDPYGVAHVIAVDYRPSLPILESFFAGDVVLIQPPEPWQILSTFDAHPDEPPLADQVDPDRWRDQPDPDREEDSL